MLRNAAHCIATLPDKSCTRQVHQSPAHRKKKYATVPMRGMRLVGNGPNPFHTCRLLGLRNNHFTGPYTSRALCNGMKRRLSLSSSPRLRFRSIESSRPVW